MKRRPLSLKSMILTSVSTCSFFLVTRGHVAQAQELPENAPKDAVLLQEIAENQAQESSILAVKEVATEEEKVEALSEFNNQDASNPGEGPSQEETQMTPDADETAEEPKSEEAPLSEVTIQETEERYKDAQDSLENADELAEEVNASDQEPTVTTYQATEEAPKDETEAPDFERDPYHLGAITQVAADPKEQDPKETVLEEIEEIVQAYRDLDTSNLREEEKDGFQNVIRGYEENIDAIKELPIGMLQEMASDLQDVLDTLIDITDNNGSTEEAPTEDDRIKDIYDDDKRPALSSLHDPEGDALIREILPDENNQVIIENGQLVRHFHVEDGQVRTLAIENKLNGDRLAFHEDSEEFHFTFNAEDDHLITLNIHDLYLKDDEGILTYEFEDVTRTEFNFKPYVISLNQKTGYLNLSYVIDLGHEDHYTRSHLRFNLSDELSSELKLSELDLQRFIISPEAKTHTFNKQEPIHEMAGFNGFYAGLGQPVYINSFFTGSEFPATLNTIDEETNTLYSRYYSGKTFENLEKDLDGSYRSWNTVHGIARTDDYQIVQQDFFAYIDDIAKPTYYRKQYNTWYDFMLDITAENIATSFDAIDRGFNIGGVSPLDSYVVDDGYQDMDTLWRFNHKFPNKLYDSSKQVKRFGSNFGLWLGPQGGYSQPGRLADALEKQGLGSKNAGVVYIGDKRYTTALANDVFKDYQKEFDINYWKLDGLLLNPRSDTDPNGNFIGGGHMNMNSMTESHERWIGLYNVIFEEATDPDQMWINLTSYIPPSPWFLQWVNSIWMQNTADAGFENHVTQRTDIDFGNDMNQATTYRDKSYQRLVEERRWQIPLKYLYNHDPVYGNYQTASKHREEHPRSPIDFSVDDLRTHLYMLATRGNGFWEFYYSHSKFTDDHWLVNGEAVNWMEENHDILQEAIYHGGKPDAGEAYGFSAWKGQEGIVSIRNPRDTAQEYTLELNNLVGMSEDLTGLHRKTVMGSDRHRTDQLTNYGDTITVFLEPYEAIVFQFSPEADTQAAQLEISRIEDGKQILLRFDETITMDSADIMVDGKDIVDVRLAADLRTLVIELAEDLADREKITVSYTGIKDLAGQANESQGQLTLTNYESGRLLDMNEIKPGEILYNAGMTGSGEFSVTIEASLDKLGQRLAQQDGEWDLIVDTDGRVHFKVGDTSVSSAPFTELKDDDMGQADYLIQPGDTFIVTALRNRNGSLRIYINGELHNTAYEGDKPTLGLNGNHIIVASENFEGNISRFILENKAQDYKTVKDLIQEIDPQPYYESASISGVKATSYDPDDNGPKPPSNAIDGDPQSYWASDPRQDNRNTSQYFTLELAEPAEIVRINYTPRHIPNAVGNMIVGSFEHSMNGENWLPVLTADGKTNVRFNPAGGRQYIDIQPTEMKFLRVRGHETAHWSDNLKDSVLAIAEISADIYITPEKVEPTGDAYLRNLSEQTANMAASIQDEYPELAQNLADLSEDIKAGENLTQAEREALYHEGKARLAELLEKLDHYELLKAQKDSARNVVNQLSGLSEEQVAEFNEQVDGATSPEEVNAVVNEALAANSEALAAEQAEREAAHQAELDRLKQEAQEAAAREAALQAELDAAKAELDRLEQEAQEAAAREAALQAELDAAKAENDRLEQEAQEAAAREAALQAELDAAKAENDRLEQEAQEAAAREAALQAELDAAKAEADRLEQKAAEREAALQAEIDQAKEREAALEAERDALLAELEEAKKALEDALAKEDGADTDESGAADDSEAGNVSDEDSDPSEEDSDAGADDSGELGADADGAELDDDSDENESDANDANQAQDDDADANVLSSSAENTGNAESSQANQNQANQAGAAEEASQQAQGETLPQTATSMWATALLGLTSLLTGLFVGKKKEK